MKDKTPDKQFNPELLINWAELSRLLSGDRSVVTRGRMPKIHLESVEKLKQKINEWYKDLL